MHPLISWRSVFAGLLISFLMMIGFLGLAMAFGGISLSERTTLESAGIFTGVWFLSSVVISIFTGSYFSARVSKFQNGRAGSAQGLVIAALFLGFFLYQTISAVVSMGGVAEIAERPAVINTVGQYAEDALGDLNLRSDPGVVAQGVAVRLIRGNTDGARNYLAMQAGITPDEADARISQLKVRADKAVDDARVMAGNALQTTGWSLFMLVLLGALSSVFGGALGSVANFRNPLSREQFTAHHQAHA